MGFPDNFRQYPRRVEANLCIEGSCSRTEHSRSGTWFRQHRRCPLIQMSHFWCKRICGSQYEPKGSRSATCPACLVNMLCLCGPSDLPTDTIHMCVSITLGNYSQGTEPQMIIWAASELYRMEEMKQRPDKQTWMITHTHTQTLTHHTSIFAMSRVYKLYHFLITKAIPCTWTTRKLSLSNTHKPSQTIMKKKSDYVTVVCSMNPLFISTDTNTAIWHAKTLFTWAQKLLWPPWQKKNKYFYRLYMYIFNNKKNKLTKECLSIGFV